MAKSGQHSELLRRGGEWRPRLPADGHICQQTSTSPPSKPPDACGSQACEIAVHPSGDWLFPTNRHVGTGWEGDPSWTRSDAVPQTKDDSLLPARLGRLGAG